MTGLLYAIPNYHKYMTCAQAILIGICFLLLGSLIANETFLIAKYPKPNSSSDTSDCTTQSQIWQDQVQAYEDQYHKFIVTQQLLNCLYLLSSAILSAVGIILIYRANSRVLSTTQLVETKWSTFVIHIVAVFSCLVTQLCWLMWPQSSWMVVTNMATQTLTNVIICSIIWSLVS